MTVKELEECIKNLPEEVKNQKIEIQDDENNYYCLKGLKIERNDDDFETLYIVFW